MSDVPRTTIQHFALQSNRRSDECQSPHGEVHAKSGPAKPAPLSYLTLWRALEPGEKDPVSGVKAPGGLKYNDTVIWTDQEHQTRWVRARSAHPNDGRHGWEEETFRFTGLPAGRYRVSAVTYPPKDRQLRRTDPTPHGVTDPVELGDEGNKQVSVKVQLGRTAPLVLHAIDAENRNDLKGLVLRLRNSEGLPIVLGSGTAERAAGGQFHAGPRSGNRRSAGSGRAGTERNRIVRDQ